MRRGSTWVPGLLVWLLAACGGRSAGTTLDARPGADASMPGPDAATGVDAAMPTGDAGVRPCSCPAGEVWRFHECVPTRAVGCGAPCEDAIDCPAGWTCEACGASTSCDTRDCRSTCAFTAVAQGPVGDSLRISPTSGPAGEVAEITIQGFPFYVGALTYGIRLGDEDLTHSMTGGGECSMIVRLPARPPGMVPVYVSEYGPSEPWNLAGFYTYSGGVTEACAQPWLHCGAFAPCCSPPEVPMGCLDGRCRPAP